MKNQINLDGLRVASPCNARWEDMAGDERARFCGSCRKNVYNLSAMTRDEIGSLIREKEGKFCGRFYQRADGRVLTADCIIGWRHSQNRMKRICGTVFASMLMILGLRGMVHAQTNDPIRSGKLGKVAVAHTNSSATNQPLALMGDVAVPPPAMGLIAPRALTGEVYIAPQQDPTTNAPSVPSPQTPADNAKTNQVGTARIQCSK